MLQRILQRAAGQISIQTAAVSRSVGRLLKVLVGDLQVVLGRHGLAVADPGANDVQRVRLGEFGLAGATEVLPKFRPRLQAGALDDPHQLRANIDSGPTVSRDDVFGAFLGFLEYFAEVRQQFREQRHHPRLAAGMVLGLRATDSDSVALPIHVDPPQRQLLGRAAQATVAAQGKQKPPLGVGAEIQHALGFVFADEVHTAGVGEDVDLLARKGIAGNQALAHRRVEELFCDAAAPADGVVGKTRANERQAPLINVAGRDLT